MRQPRVGSRTPWGTADAARAIAPGIVNMGTPSHGGIWLDGAHCEAIARQFPDFQPYAGYPWFEEDCDACVVVLSFPQHFEDAVLRGAYRSVFLSFLTEDTVSNRRGWAQVQSWLQGTTEDPQAAAIRERVKAFEDDHVDHWECRSLWGPVQGAPRGSWGVELTRVGDKRRQSVVFRDYPAQRFYTDAELEQRTYPADATAAA